MHTELEALATLKTTENLAANSLIADLIKHGKQVIDIEANAVANLKSKIDNNFAGACQLLLNTKGRIIVTGMGKSGHIGNKIAATLASTGSPAQFVHPAEACHGDLGMITNNDTIIAISNSGETQEILMILPVLKRIGAPIVSITGNPNSSLAKIAKFNLDINIKQEACTLNLAPTASTTATLAMGDAIAISLLNAKGFSSEDFAFAHPGGSLGRRLLLKIKDIMHKDSEVPIIQETVCVKACLIEMSRCRLGICAIVDPNQKITGVFTDGDLRRALDANIDINSTPIKNVMTIGGTLVNQNLLAAEALQIMESKKINALIVIDDNKNIIGALNMHDLLRAKVI